MSLEDRFEVAWRGYDRRQVEEFVARSRREVADMRSRLARTLREAEQLRVDLGAARRAAWETAGQGERAAGSPPLCGPRRRWRSRGTCGGHRPSKTANDHAVASMLLTGPAASHRSAIPADFSVRS